jgi:hypothetical protein
MFARKPVVVWMYVPGLWIVRQFILYIRRSVFGSGLDAPVFLLTHHKVGTKLTRSVFRDLARKRGWKFCGLRGLVKEIPENTDVIQLIHGMVDEGVIGEEHRGVRIIRDPRDVIVSGYLYHQRCDEQWCLNTDFTNPERRFPQVPWPLDGATLGQRESFVESLGGISYQENLRRLGDDEGLVFEMDGYAGITVQQMVGWRTMENVLTIKMEDMMNDYDGSFERIFRWLNFEEEIVRDCVKVAGAHDMNRMTKEEIEAHHHISTGKLRKWEAFFTDEVKTAYSTRFGDAHLTLGYSDFDYSPPLK